MFREIAVDAVILISLIGIAIGRLPLLKMNRAAISIAGAVALVAFRCLSLEEAFAAVDLRTISLLLAMMILAVNLRISGFFSWASVRVLSFAKSPKNLLASTVLVSGVFSAFFLNDTMCIVLTPLIAELSISLRRDPVPYLIGVATAANVGSCATIIGNPQNMLIGASSGIAFPDFTLRLVVPSLLGLLVCWIFIMLAFPGEFRGDVRFSPPSIKAGATENPFLLRKSLAAAAGMVLALIAGAPTVLAALMAAAFLLVSRSTESERVFKDVDFSLLVFFSGLFIITRGIEKTALFSLAARALVPVASRSSTFFVGISLILSNLVSNVPAVMLLRPMIPSFPDPRGTWLLLALASTFAGNLTLLGSVANLIVAEGAKRSGIGLSFWKYMKAGFPITIATTVLGTLWLVWVV